MPSRMGLIADCIDERACGEVSRGGLGGSTGFTGFKVGRCTGLGSLSISCSPLWTTSTPEVFARCGGRIVRRSLLRELRAFGAQPDGGWLGIHEDFALHESGLARRLVRGARQANRRSLGNNDHQILGALEGDATDFSDHVVRDFESIGLDAGIFLKVGYRSLQNRQNNLQEGLPRPLV